MNHRSGGHRGNVVGQWGGVRQRRDTFLEDGPFPLSIISDRQKGLLPAINELSIVDFTIKH